MVESQIDILILDLSFVHKLCYKFSIKLCKPILDIYISKVFKWYKELFNLMSFDS
jgi:hypothetical protein